MHIFSAAGAFCFYQIIQVLRMQRLCQSPRELLKASAANVCAKPTREQGNGGDWRGAVAVRLKGFCSQRLCQTQTGVVGPVLVPPAGFRKKGCAKPKREHGNRGSGGTSAGAAGAVAVRNKGFCYLLQLFWAARLAL